MDAKGNVEEINQFLLWPRTSFDSCVPFSTPYQIGKVNQLLFYKRDLDNLTVESACGVTVINEEINDPSSNAG